MYSMAQLTHPQLFQVRHLRHGEEAGSSPGQRRRLQPSDEDQDSQWLLHRFHPPPSSFHHLRAWRGWGSCLCLSARPFQFFSSFDHLVCLSVCLFVWVPVCQPVCLSFSLYVCPLACLSVTISVCLFLPLSVSDCICLCLSVCLCHSVCPYVCCCWNGLLSVFNVQWTSCSPLFH